MVDFTQIFRDGSTTYYYSSLFFPASVRSDVSVLYSFVRTADDFVDTIPQQEEAFRAFRQDALAALDGEDVDDEIITAFIDLHERQGFKRDWVEAFLDSMAMDLERSRYDTMDELQDYIYGSAEVIGLMMCRLLGIDEDAFPAAKLQGRAMQYMNFLRDIGEDQELGRQYIPQEVIEQYGLTALDEDHARQNDDAFRNMMHGEIDRYRSWQQQADDGHSAIPYRTRVPVRMAARLYGWTAERVERRPFIVYDRCVKPSRPRVAAAFVRSLW